VSTIPVIEELASTLGDFREQFVLVGGAVLELLITDPAVIDFRPTTDIDLVVEAATYGTFSSIEQKLSDRGFAHMVGPDIPICRWRIGTVVADIMPTEESVLGFGNRWYPDVVRSAQRHALPSGTVIRRTAPEYFIATKLDAFRTRGNGDARLSYDMEDIIAVLDGRAGIDYEIVASTLSVKSYIAEEFQKLSRDTDFRDAVQGYLCTATDSVARHRIVLERIDDIILHRGRGSI